MRNKLIILLAIVIIGIIGYNYLYKDHRDIVTEKSEFVLTSTSLSSEFSGMPSESELKYLNKTIEVSGIVSEINQHDLTLTEQVFCQFSDDINTSIKLNSEIKVKGRLIGYDDLLEQVKLDQCSVVK